MTDDHARESGTGLTEPRFTRRTALRIGAVSLGGAVLAGLLPGRTRAGGGNSDCAHFCDAIYPPGPGRGQCKSAAAHGTGVCGSCVDSGGFTCGGPVASCPGAGAGSGCFCFTSSEGTPGCGANDFCSNLVSCPNGQSDCPANTFCTVNTCCGGPVCVQDCTGTSGASVVRRLVGSGPMVTG
jgi:hypothetical protein